MSNPGLTIQDLEIMESVIRALIKRGCCEPEEASDVGTLYKKIKDVIDKAKTINKPAEKKWPPNRPTIQENADNKIDV